MPEDVSLFRGEERSQWAAYAQGSSPDGDIGHSADLPCIMMLVRKLSELPLSEAK